MQKTKVWIGAHTSAQGGAPNALYQGKEIGATAIQFFTSNQKQWKGRSIEPQEIEEWEKALKETEIEQIMSHDSYLINLGSIDPEILEKSRGAFAAEIKRCHLLNLSYLNFHPGAFTTGSLDACLDTIVESLSLLEPLINLGNTTLLLETTAGQGTSVGYKFEHLSYIVKRLYKKIPLGVCIDTCHIFAAGYDIRGEAGVERVLEQFDQEVGLEFLYAFHLNDSQKDLGSRVDRHANLGEGKIGMEAFEFLMSSSKTAHLPKYLETPGGPPTWTKEIAKLKESAL